MTPKFELSFAIDNDIFVADAPAEVARILRETADRITRGVSEGIVFDSNGNRIGYYSTDEIEEGEG